jgi:hypothetical protein
MTTVQFDPSLGWWSPAVFWYVVVSIGVCLIFCAVVFVGGAFDLAYLLRELDKPDDTQDGSTPKSP